jgi:hypothetical protein
VQAFSFAHRVAISNRRLISADHNGMGLRGAANRGTAQRLLRPDRNRIVMMPSLPIHYHTDPRRSGGHLGRSAHPRDFVLWRFSDADLSSTRIVSPSPA